jgi:hypothetical protein
MGKTLERVTAVARIAALTAATFLCTTGGLVLLKARKVVVSLDATVQQLQADAKHVDRTLKNADYLILSAGLTAHEAQKASTKEYAILDGLNTRLQSTLLHVDDLVVTTGTQETALLSAGTDAVKQTAPVLAEATATLSQLRQTEKDLDAVVTDPAIQKTLDNVQMATLSTSASMSHVDGTTADIQTAVHKYLNPGWKTSVANWTLKVVHAAGGFF